MGQLNAFLFGIVCCLYHTSMTHPRGGGGGCVDRALFLVGGSTACWVSVNVEPLRTQFLGVQAKRIALGKTIVL